ncbi:MAG: sel1 repeat family protein [Lachnospiraceae bacterium]|nr:sel1 repeat family protein [Lachnospiraceae bacterium]
MKVDEYNNTVLKLKKNAENGDVGAMAQLGSLYYRGVSGNEQNIADAFPYWKMAADRGNDECALIVGKCLQRGDGCTRDPSLGFSYLRKSANSGNVEALDCVAECYMDGFGVEEDYRKGYDYLRKAAALGHQGAKSKLGFYKEPNEYIRENQTGDDDYSNSYNTKSSGSEGCYIATAVYGSYDAPEVLVLRDFRDSFLNVRWWGRGFIKFYYFCSPSIAHKLQKTKRFNLIIRDILNHFVRYLMEREKEWHTS